MGKRSNFERKPRDFYPTPYKAVAPLIDYLDYSIYREPCAGTGELIKHLGAYGFNCIGATDIESRTPKVKVADATSAKYKFPGEFAHQFITNPPWDRKILHPIIENLRMQAVTWLLIDADWAHTKQAVPYLQYCSHIVAVGRVKWIPDSKNTGKDNCCWYKFNSYKTETVFYGRI